MRMLVAEDDSVSREVMRTYLGQFGTCDIATDGMAAIDAYLESLRTHAPYDLFFLDIMMPKVDGLKVLDVIRGFEEEHADAGTGRLKIVMLTAVSAMECVDEAFELGCDAYVSKPVDLAKVRKLMDDLGVSVPAAGDEPGLDDTPDKGSTD